MDEVIKKQIEGASDLTQKIILAIIGTQNVSITTQVAVDLLPRAVNLAIKLFEILKSGDPQNIDEELAALMAARMKTSDEIIAEADAASKKG
jgi:hypothetical protein